MYKIDANSHALSFFKRKVVIAIYSSDKKVVSIITTFFRSSTTVRKCNIISFNNTKS